MAVRTIPLTQGKEALVDDQDYEFLNQWKWYADKRKHTWYASRNRRKSEGSPRTILMHEALLPDSKGVDHKDGDGLNNQRSNLRPASTAQNNRNTTKRANTSSRFKGVYWHKSTGKWQARIGTGVSGQHIYLGEFESELDAAKAYNKAAAEKFGEFARLNECHG